jgi:hypothetical protein
MRSQTARADRRSLHSLHDEAIAVIAGKKFPEPVDRRALSAM